LLENLNIDYKKSLLNQIEMLHDKDPKQYWKLIEELKDTEKIDTTFSISSDGSFPLWIGVIYPCVQFSG
jgi:FPC/CPF motif-containing protein YcgG